MSTLAPAGAGTSGTIFLPDEGPDGARKLVTKVDACPAFLLAAHPERITVMGGQVIPCFTKVKYRAGLNGAEVRELPGGRRVVKLGAARDFWIEQGWTIIPIDKIPASHGKSYLWCPDGRPDVHLLIYEKCFAGSDTIACDEERYLEFCTYLRTTGVLPAPALHVLQKLLDVKRVEAAREADRAEKNRAARPAAERLQRDVEAIEREIAAQAGSATPVGGNSITIDDEDASPVAGARSDAPTPGAVAELAAARAVLEDERAEIAREREAMASERKRLEAERKRAAKAAEATPPATPPADPQAG